MNQRAGESLGHLREQVRVFAGRVFMPGQLVLGRGDSFYVLFSDRD